MRDILRNIPLSALILSLLGTLPFIAAAFMIAAPGFVADLTGTDVLRWRLLGPPMLRAYALVILAFMSGVLWGFATKTEGKAAMIGYVASVVPALFAFATSLSTIAFPVFEPFLLGFLALLVFDFAFWRAGLAPQWWMHLRILITAIVTLCFIAAMSA